MIQDLQSDTIQMVPLRFPATCSVVKTDLTWSKHENTHGAKRRPANNPHELFFGEILGRVVAALDVVVHSLLQMPVAQNLSSLCYSRAFKCV